MPEGQKYSGGTRGIPAQLRGGVMSAPGPGGEQKGRYLQLIIGLVCMVMIANLQYGWNLFVDPMSKTHGWSRAAIGGAFSIFVLAETWLVPVESWFVDK